MGGVKVFVETWCVISRSPALSILFGILSIPGADWGWKFEDGFSLSLILLGRVRLKDSAKYFALAVRVNAFVPSPG